MHCGTCVWLWVSVVGLNVLIVLFIPQKHQVTLQSKLYTDRIKTQYVCMDQRTGWLYVCPLRMKQVWLKHRFTDDYKAFSSCCLHALYCCVLFVFQWNRTLKGLFWLCVTHFNFHRNKCRDANLVNVWKMAENMKGTPGMELCRLLPLLLCYFV